MGYLQQPNVYRIRDTIDLSILWREIFVVSEHNQQECRSMEEEDLNNKWWRSVVRWKMPSAAQNKLQNTFQDLKLHTRGKAKVVMLHLKAKCFAHNKYHPPPNAEIRYIMNAGDIWMLNVSCVFHTKGCRGGRWSIQKQTCAPFWGSRLMQVFVHLGPQLGR